MRVTLRDETSGAVPDLPGRTAYRVVREGLTNARKHAPGAEVHVALAGAPGAGLTVEVRNDALTPTPDPAAPGARDTVAASGPDTVAASGPEPGAGQGLAGLAERVALASGRLEHGPTAGGGWRLAVRLPWPA
jgi:signal transduction histidine kinase